MKGAYHYKRSHAAVPGAIGIKGIGNAWELMFLAERCSKLT